MNAAIPWYKSPVYIGVVVNLIAGLVNILNLQHVVTLEFINSTVAAVFTVAGVVTAVIAEYKRRTSPIQPIAATQASANRQSGRAGTSMLMVLVGLGMVTAMAVSAGCATINPMKRAESVEQKAYALYGSFVVFEEQAAKLVAQPDVPQSVKTALRDADAVAKPVADKLIDAAQAVLAIRLEIEAGTSSKEKLLIALENLDRYISEAGPKIKALGSAIKEAA